MSEREPPGYDDWFDEPEPPTLESGRGRQAYDAPSEAEEDVWMLPEDRPRRRRDGRGGDFVIGGHALTTTQIAILAIALLAVLIAILAAAGVFSGTPAATTLTNTTPTTLPTTATTSTTPTVQVPTQTLQSGDTGAQVKLLQRALTALGYSPGKADGSFGAGTKAAVQNFQNDHALLADGVVGPQTLKALGQAVKALGG